MIDMLIQIPGPIFFIGWGLLFIVYIILGRFWLHLDRSTDYPMPAMNQLNAFEIAALQRGNLGVIEIALFNLWHRQLLEITTKRWSKRIKQREISQEIFENDIEKVVYDFAHIERKPREFFESTHLRFQLKPYLNSINQQLENWHLKRTSAKIKKMWLILGIIFVIISSIALAKLFFIIDDDINIISEAMTIEVTIGLIYLIIIFLAIFDKILRLSFVNSISYTKLGRRYQKQLAQHFEWLKSKKDSDEVDPALVVALFGISALANFEGFALFTKTFQSANSSSGGSSGGGGGDCDGGGGGGGGD